MTKHCTAKFCTCNEGAKLPALDRSQCPYWLEDEATKDDYVVGVLRDTAAQKEREPLLVERQKTHGSFEQNAEISQKLKATIANGTYGAMCMIHREARDMICLKISRIASGQANYADHWKDVSGYALLALEACKEKEK